jgi:hypothetical protein
MLLVLKVEAGEGEVPAEDVFALVNELYDSDVGSAEAVRAESPDRTKGTGQVLTEVLVDVLPTALPSALLVVQGWLLRHRDQTIRVKVGDDEIEIPRDVDPEVALNLAERLKGLGRTDTGHTPAGPAG